MFDETRSQRAEKQPSSQHDSTKKYDKQLSFVTEQVSELENKILELEQSKIETEREVNSLKTRFLKFEKEYDRLKINRAKDTSGYKAYQIISLIMTIIAMVIAVYISFQILGPK